jgi:Cd2+/Zn2+-exporting ATPase
MGRVGSDAAIEAADIVIMNDEPSKLITAIRVARKTRTIVWQNIAGALVVKGIVLLLGAMDMPPCGRLSLLMWVWRFLP